VNASRITSGERITSELRFVTDAPPGPESGRFVEVEDEHGYSVSIGEWRERPDGLWELVVQGTFQVNRGTVC
jgi:hypothetical protein